MWMQAKTPIKLGPNQVASADTEPFECADACAAELLALDAAAEVAAPAAAAAEPAAPAKTKK